MYVLAESGQKHIIYRARVAHDRDFYPVQHEEQTVFVDRAQLAACIDAFEVLLAMGFTRDEIATGRYAQGRLLKVDRAAWLAADAQMAQYRAAHPEWVRLALLAAHNTRTSGAS